jgi:hypothetical protein
MNAVASHRAFSWKQQVPTHRFLDLFPGEFLRLRLSNFRTEGGYSFLGAACCHRLLGIIDQSSFFLNCSRLWRCIVDWYGNVRMCSLPLSSNGHSDP